jgi:hypothetical protein
MKVTPEPLIVAQLSFPGPAAHPHPVFGRVDRSTSQIVYVHTVGTEVIKVEIQWRVDSYYLPDFR